MKTLKEISEWLAQRDAENKEAENKDAENAGEKKFERLEKCVPEIPVTIYTDFGDEEPASDAEEIDEEEIMKRYTEACESEEDEWLSADDVRKLIEECTEEVEVPESPSDVDSDSVEAYDDEVMPAVLGELED